jgi:hypothetical protein
MDSKLLYERICKLNRIQYLKMLLIEGIFPVGSDEKVKISEEYHRLLEEYENGCL